jgi:tetratricopeptide (TPR) repeat protein
MTQEPLTDLFSAGDCGSTIARNILRTLAMQNIESGCKLLDVALQHTLVRSGFRAAATGVLMPDLETWFGGTDQQFEYNHVQLADRVLSQLHLPRDWRFTKLLMMRACAAGDYAGAREVATNTLETAGKQVPDEVVLGCSNVLAQVYSAQGEFEPAAKYYAEGAEAARRTKHDFEEWDQRVGLIWSLQSLDRPLEALREIDAAETIACRMEDCDALAKTLIDRGNTLRGLGRRAEARHAYEGALAAADAASNAARKSDSLGNLGTIAHLEGDFAAAENFHRRALEISRALPDQQSAQYDLNNLALALWSQGRSAEALGYEEEALGIARLRNDRDSVEQYCDSVRRMSEALGLSPGGDAKALQSEERASEEEKPRPATPTPKAPDPVEMKVRALLNEGRPGEAIQFLEEHLVQNPNDGSARSLNAVMLARTGNQKEAFEQMERAVEQALDDMAVHFRRVDVYTIGRRLEELLGRYADAIVDEPFRASFRVGLALVYSRLGRTDEACQQGLEAVHLAPDQALALRVLAEAQFNMAMSRLRPDWDAAWTAFQDCVITLHRLTRQPGEQQGQWLYFAAQCFERFAVASFESNPPLHGTMESRELRLLAVAGDYYQQTQKEDPWRKTERDEDRVGEMIRAFGSPEQIVEAARYLRMDGNLAGVLLLLILSLQKEPRQGAAYYELACTMDAMGDLRAAQDYIRSALEFDPKNEEYREAKRRFDRPQEEGPKLQGESHGEDH